MILAILATALVYAFIICCVVSAALQIVAWSRHSREGVRASFRGVWRPEGLFDEIGLRQMRIARTLLIVGGFAYVVYGGVMVITSIAGGVTR
jgi:hypothetical protein